MDELVKLVTSTPLCTPININIEKINELLNNLKAMGTFRYFLNSRGQFVLLEKSW